MIVSTNILFYRFESSGFGLQVSSRLAELEATLDAGIRHRNKALTSVGFHLAKWMNMVRYWSCLPLVNCYFFGLSDKKY